MISRRERHLRTALRGMGLGRLGQDQNTPSLPDFNDRTWSDYQKVFAQQQATTVDNAPPYLHPDLTFFLPPADSKPFIVTPTLFVAYPAVGATATIITYIPPSGQIAVINKLAIVHVGGNPPDGTGNIVWSVQVNGAGIQGLSQLTSQVGTYANPNDVEILIIEGDTLTITVTTVANQPNATTAARISGWNYPISEALLPQLAQ